MCIVALEVSCFVDLFFCVGILTCCRWSRLGQSLEVSDAADLTWKRGQRGLPEAYSACFGDHMQQRCFDA